MSSKWSLSGYIRHVALPGLTGLKGRLRCCFRNGAEIRHDTERRRGSGPEITCKGMSRCRMLVVFGFPALCADRLRWG